MPEPTVVYGKEGCPYTRALLRKLRHDGVEHVVHDVQQDRVRLQEMLALNGQRREVPTVAWSDGRVEVGFHGT